MNESETERAWETSIQRSRSSLTLSLSLSLPLMFVWFFILKACTTSARLDVISLSVAAIPLFLRRAFRRWKSSRPSRRSSRTFGGRKTFVLSRSDVSEPARSGRRRPLSRKPHHPCRSDSTRLVLKLPEGTLSRGTGRSACFFHCRPARSLARFCLARPREIPFATPSRN